jgi:hypothetical protein
MVTMAQFCAGTGDDLFRQNNRQQEAVVILGFVAGHCVLLAKRDRKGRARNGFLQPQRRRCTAGSTRSKAALCRCMSVTNNLLSSMWPVDLHFPTIDKTVAQVQVN